MESMIVCDLCGEPKECLQKEIDGSEFDICAECWRPLEEKLKGKGRLKKKRETVLLPPRTALEPEEPKTPPGLPPKIFGRAETATYRAKRLWGQGRWM
jgi:ribosome-binding protein aMBF1 (putative translation factor)